MLAALAGGVGAARFLDGLLRVVPPSEVVVVVNTADDDEFHGLHVSPDLDSVTYTLAGASNTAQGWGLEGETFATLDALARFGVPTWFRLGDKDLATHVYRTQRLRAGMPLSSVTAEISAAWGLDVRLLPMSDDRVRTRITVAREHGTEELAMQEWFVGERAESPVVAVHFEGADAARPAPGVLEALRDADTIVICPSNPVISIGPLLAVPGIREVLASRRARVVGVSPIVGGAPVKGPADRLMAPLGIDVS
ncbi:MAG TPA: 2-phospho-L-lactate transferase, partial [Acidimicrobiia bacterium]|nr:2-phospho-L-lactate transferase [Acidimicrobiia bacterium]